MSKLTLHVDGHLIRAAKEEASARRTSVSKLVSDYFRVLGAKDPEKSEQVPLPPITASLLGCIPGADSHVEDPVQAYVGDLLTVFGVAPVTRVALEAAIASPIEDFEDAVLHEAAVRAGADCIVTRNTADFRLANLPVYTPAQAVQAMDW